MAEAPAILYSFRRCPYAIRARLALEVAGLRPGRELLLREVALKAKPAELLACSPKGTVPVLQCSDGRLLEQSLAIMHWALEQADPQGWWQGWSPAEQALMHDLIAENDGPFKHHLDRFKYPDRYPAEASALHRRALFAILRRWNRRLSAGGWLLGDRPALADWALLPFVRQCRLADPQGFAAEADLQPLQAWLDRFVSGPALQAVMADPWAPRLPWRSPRWLYHLALRDDWQRARAAGDYRCSTRGRSLEEVGFIHLSQAHQLAATAARFYGDLPASQLLLLTLDPQRLEAAGLPVRLEPAPASGELFPHLYGPLPLQAVLLAEPFAAAGGPP